MRYNSVADYGSIFIRLAVVGSEIQRNSPKIRTYFLICDFLLVINSNFGLSPTTFEILTFKAKIWLVFPPILGLVRPLRGTRRNLWVKPRKNYRDVATVW